MVAIRRSIAVLVAVAGMIAAFLAFGGSASAAPYSNQQTVTVSTTTPAEGGTLTVGGTGFQAGETVNLTLHTAVYNLGSTKADATGSFSTSVTLPDGVTGSHTIVATGASSGVTASISICIGGNCSTAGGGSGGGSGGGLATTGVAVISIGGVGVLLLLGGGAMLMAGRRRRATV